MFRAEIGDRASTVSHFLTARGCLKDTSLHVNGRHGRELRQTCGLFFLFRLFEVSAYAFRETISQKVRNNFQTKAELSEN